MNWLSLVRLFSGPLGNLVNSAITAGSAAAIGYAVAKGVPEVTATEIAGGLTLAIGAIINMATGTQIVKIQDVRADQTNGVTVVRADDAAKARLQRVDSPQNMG